MMMGGTASQDGNLACIVVIDRIIVVIYLIRKSGAYVLSGGLTNQSSY